MPKNLDIVLVNPNHHSSVFEKNIHIPCGLGFIARVLEVNRCTYKVVDLNFQTENELFEIIYTAHPTYLGIGMMTYRVETSYRLLDSIKQNNPQLKIIVGGPHVIAAQLSLFQDCSAIDIACVGEGEDTIVELMSGVPLNDIKGIYYRTITGVRTTPPREFSKTMDNIPFPTYTGFQLKRYGRSMLLSSSRGCPYKCTFCGAPHFLGKKWRKRTAEGMKAEFLYWYNYGYREFFFEDSLFSADKKRIHAFCDELISMNLPVSIDVHGARADHFDESLMLKMKQAKFRSLVFGVESAANHVLEAFKKGESIEQIERTLCMADKIGFQLGLFFIIGGPGESYQDVEQSLAFAQRFENASFAYFFKLTPVPGTPYFDYAIEKGYVDENQKYPTGNFGFEDYAVVGNDVMTVRELTTALRKARKVEKLIRNRFSVRQTLKGFFRDRKVPKWIVELLSHILLNKFIYLIARRVYRFTTS